MKYPNTTLCELSLLQLASKMNKFKLSFVLLNLVFFVTTALASDPWTIIVPTAAQGSTDVLTRGLGEKIAGYLGESVRIENIPGNSGTIAANKIFTADPTAKVLMMATVSSHAIAFGITPSPSYKADDFSPIALIGIAPYLLMVSNSSPFSTARELFDAAKRTSLTYSSTGTKGPHHLVAELIAKQAHMEMIHKPFSAGADALKAVSSGTVDLMLPASILALPKIKDGSLRVLATTGSQRSKALPLVPTISESGLTGFAAESWYVLLGPPKMTAESIERIEKAVTHALQDTEYLKLLANNGVDPGFMKREDINPFLFAESKKWGELVLQLDTPAKVVTSQCQSELSKLKSAEQFAITARDGLITTRRQAQDFKNVLLRFWSEQAQTMQSRLAERNNELNSITQSLEILTNSTGEHAEIIETIRSEGIKISKTYASAITKLEPTNPLSIFVADEHAKGIDITIFRSFETLVSLTTTNMNAQRNKVFSNCH